MDTDAFSPGETMPLERKKVIVVDDNPVNLDLAKNTLKDGYDVFTVSGGESLFKLLENVIPDIILLDVLMPGMNGYEILSILKKDKRTSGIPVVFISSQSDPQSEHTGFSLGALDYIAKPFSPPILRKRVEVILLMESQKTELRRMNGILQEMVNEKTRDIDDLQNAVLRTLGNLVVYRDVVTGSHIGRAETLLSHLLDEMLKQGAYNSEIEIWDRKLLLQSAHLHDVGKIAIQDRILLKPGSLTPAELIEMQKHTIFGEKIIDKIIQSTKENDFVTHAKLFAGTHHERWDGTGYPRKMKGEHIPLQGRLMAIVDVYDALVSERPYKKPFSPEKAIEHIKKGRGTHFDPIIADVFIGTIRKYR